MKKLFPEMTGCLNGGQVFCIMAYWVIAFVLLPFFIPLVLYGAWDDMRYAPWVELIYHVINGLVMVAVLKEVLSDSIFEFEIDKKGFWKTLSISTGLMLLYTCLIANPICLLLENDYWHISDYFPMSEMSVAMTAGLMVNTIPIPAILCLTLLSSFAISGMFYASGFGPVAYRVPWLGYVTVSVLLLIPSAFDIFWRGNASYVMTAYLLRLPVHWFACWSYQKTSNILAPIASLGIINLLSSLLFAL